MTSELRPAVEVWWKATDAWKEGLSPEDATQAAAAVIEADREAVRAEQAAELAKWKEQRLLDHGRLLWREDVETHCPNADLCFEYSATVRCSPCAIKQSDAEGVEALSLNGVYQPEVARLNRELAKFKALAETLAGALEKIAEGTYPRPLGKPWRMDASSSKHDRCIHDAWMYETCEGCLDAFVAEALRQYKEARDD